MNYGSICSPERRGRSSAKQGRVSRASVKQPATSPRGLSQATSSSATWPRLCGGSALWRLSHRARIVRAKPTRTAANFTESRRFTYVA